MDLSDSKVRRRVNKRFREKGIPAKVCGKCFVVKGHGAFTLRKPSPDGRSNQCRDCANAVGQEWYSSHRERKLEYAKARPRKREDPVRKAAYACRWRVERRAERAAYNREWRRSHPEKVREWSQARRARNAGVPVEPFTASDLRQDWDDHDLWSCFYCGNTLSDGYDVEHFYPKFPDDEETTPPGPHAVWNLVPSCAACNRGVDGKHSREPWQFLRESLAEQGVDLDAAIAVFVGRQH
ncbi:HNH endonuclease family protein [Streptomyces griseoluteus]|uniref:hypothetical protein n=1 Tax=Streptomyces griseoluteus TaxID=29306 RepID=UPI0036460A4F